MGIKEQLKLFLALLNLLLYVFADEYCDGIKTSDIKVLLEIDDPESIYPSYDYVTLNDINIKYNGAHFNGTKMKVICKKILNKINKAESIIFDNVNFERIENDAWTNMDNLKYLGIVNDNIQKIHFKINGLNNVKLITLEENHIEDIERNTFYDLPKLEVFQLSHNKINELKDWCKNCPLLSEIGLDNNKLTILPTNAFTTINSDLRVNLTINNNTIERIEDGALDHLKQIGFLHLADNKLEEIPKKFLINLRKGYKLDLSFNQLKCIPEHLFEKLQYIDLIGNPLTKKCITIIKDLANKFNTTVVYEEL